MHLIRLSLLLLLASSSASVQHPPPMSMSGCASSLAALYPCLWYLATPPEYSPPTPSLACCATFFQALSTAGPKCVCHVVQQPLVLGYTIDTGKLIDLFPVCGLRDSVFALRWFHHACQAARNEILSPATGIAPAPGPANVANPNSAGMAIWHSP
ncbi:Bifunctional inhibitor/lipid-transfer protein/seed storage 2S albumin superfamily protein [Rhynchospora pubera]|uniref:Bifunctional inhibitor/lipid-transfer protein/seed storage 2S albumin superfamily protein n=1 Tax=Rhynchospora pubera TaxID=906938 RepID=A0AAV8FSA9_9POAL|nr:Bifunctional inhibitor/lipid-transfer protein/seed storage 2S albumin superfamily protein [Rhynchospora pubera]